MLFLMCLLLFTNTTLAVESVGSVLFYKRNSDECWTQDELAKLRARKIFENVVIPCRPPDKITAKYNKQVLRYFRRALRSVEDRNDYHNTEILKAALADTIGGYLRSEFLPNTRFAYYAGYVPYSSAQKMHDFYDQVKTDHLNTGGLGWRVPREIPLESNLTVGKILIGPGKPFDPCEGLLIRRDNNNCIRIPLPMVEDSNMPHALALPFKVGGFVSLTSPNSENIMLKYYTTAARCILRSSPSECRHTDFVNFNNELWHWMKRHVAPHLLDERLYPAYGGVLRVAAAVQNYGKGLARRNMYDEDDFDPTTNKWNAFKVLMDKTLNIDTDWTPPIALILVLGTAFAICFLHIIYTYVLGRAGGCHCMKMYDAAPQVRMSNASGMNYTKVDSTFPAVLPSHGGPRYSEDTRRSKRSSRSMSASMRSQEVHEFKDNKVNMMMINEKTSELYSSSELTDEGGGSGGERVEDGAVSVHTLAEGSRHGSRQGSRQCTPRSPPKIEASVAQLKIKQRTRRRERYSPSSATGTGSPSEEATYCHEPSDTLWSDSGSSAGSGSCSDDSHSRSPSASQSQSLSQTQITRRSRRSQPSQPSRASRRDRDLAWARRVVSKQNLTSQSQTVKSTGTYDSYTTPPSKR